MMCLMRIEMEVVIKMKFMNLSRREIIMQEQDFEINYNEISLKLYFNYIECN